eukprot:577991-Hanusia_phi.AAC.1
MKNIFVGGVFGMSNGTASFFDRISSGGYDSFLIKFNAFGSFLWLRTIGNETDDILYSIKVDLHGSVIVSGIRSWRISNGTCLEHQNELFVQKYSNAGQMLFSTILPVGYTQNNSDIAVSAQSVFVLMGMQSTDSPWFTSTQTRTFLINISSNSCCQGIKEHFNFVCPAGYYCPAGMENLEAG